MIDSFGDVPGGWFTATDACNRQRSAGFTLLELLVVMALMSLLVVAMASALRTTSQTSERVDHALARSDDLRIVSGFLQSSLSRISLQKRTYPYAEGGSQYFFEGEESRVTWLGVMPAGYATGGRTLMRLQLAASGQGGQALVFQYLPWTDPSAEPDWAQASTNVLLNGVNQWQVMYQDARAEPPTWTTHWMIPDQVPQRIRITLYSEQDRQRPLPDFVIALRPLVASDPRARGPVFGGDIK